MTPGIHKLTMPEYLSLKALSSGLIHTLLTQSPFHARHEQENRDQDDSTASDTGSAIHSALLEGMDIVVPVDAKDWRTNAAKDMRQIVRDNGKIPILAHKVPQIEAAVGAAKEFLSRSELRGVFDSGAPEQTIVWKEGDTLCKARPDWMCSDQSVMLHLKTTEGSAGPAAFSRTVDNMGYDLSLAFYERGLWTAGGPDGWRHVILAVEQSEPYGCALYDLDPAKTAIAAAAVARAIATWQQCEASGKWPAYSGRVHSLEPKPWQLAEEERAQVGGVFDALTAGEL